MAFEKAVLADVMRRVVSYAHMVGEVVDPIETVFELLSQRSWALGQDNVLS
jgi:NTP pyrophosphatase (non-canonical NTP hydrolase)